MGVSHMSLDIYLIGGMKVKKSSSGIFIRENGQTKEITREEWDRRYPGTEPVVFKGVGKVETSVMFEANITHNLTTMASICGLYCPMWKPEIHGWVTASDIIRPLETGLEELKSNPEKYKEHNPENGWGSYELLISVAEDYLAACRENPSAVIEVSR